MSVWGFWIVAGAMALGVAGILLAALKRGHAGDGPAAAYDLRVYRDQLREVEKDAARGLIAPGDADRARTEIARRVLEADRALQSEGAAQSTPRGARVLAGGVIVLVAVAGSLALYHRIGAPGYGDLPLAQRIAEAEALRENRMRQPEAEARAAGIGPLRLTGEPDPRHMELMEQLRVAVAENPTDIQGQELLARNEAMLGNYAAAHPAQAAVIALKGPVATAADYAFLADLMVLAAGGYVSPEAESALTEVLRRDPENGLARYYSGLMFAQTGRPDRAFAFWRRLLETSAPDDRWTPPIRAQIEEMARRAGDHRYVLPPAATGPTAADMEAAGALSPEERDGMARGMVAQLNARLATDGGTAEDWARLIRAYGVLGDTGAARAIRDEAEQVFAGHEVDLALVRAAAEEAGVAP